MLTKRMTAIGNSLGVIIDRPILNAMGIDATTTVAIAIQGDAIVITRVEEGVDREANRQETIRRSAAKVMKAHASNLKKLAE